MFVWSCFREKQLDRLQELSRAAEQRDRRSAAWLKSSSCHGAADVHAADARKMQADQQQDQRRERERALIVDKTTAGCVADAVNQHFQESLKHVEQKVNPVSPDSRRRLSDVDVCIYDLFSPPAEMLKLQYSHSRAPAASAHRAVLISVSEEVLLCIQP